MPTDQKASAADCLVLGIWEAVTLLDEANERCDEADVADLLEKAEAILISLVSEIPALARSAGGSVRANGFAWAAETASMTPPNQEPFGYRSRDC
jgi:hypothetical protein